MADLSSLQTSYWAKLTTSQRIEALQGLENSMAAEQGRQPREIQSSKLSDTTRGKYSPKDPSNLHVNEKLIKSNDGNYQTVQTTIHEGRHAYQDDCVQGKIAPLPQDQGKVESWAHNMPGRGGVYNPSSVAYRYQPVEADANSYAKDKVNSFGYQYGNDPAYNQFCAKRDMQDRYSESVAKSTYGDDYENVIRQDIDKRWQAKYQQESNGQKVMEKTGGKKGMFDFKNDKAQRQQSSQSPSQQSSQDKGKAFRQSLKVDTSKQQPATKKSSGQSSSSSQSGTPSAAQRERTRSASPANASKYKASAKTSKQSISSSKTKSKGGQAR